MHERIFQRHAGEPEASRWPLIVAGLAGGAAVGLYTFTRRGKTSAVLAAAGMLALVRRMQAEATADHTAQASFVVNCDPARAYGFWKEPENLPRFMPHLKSVRATSEHRAQWTLAAPFDTEIRWTVETTEDIPNARIAWRSVADSMVAMQGHVEFKARPNGRGTLVTAVVAYDPPADEFGQAVAIVLGKNPQFLLREDLRRFKALIEAGEVPTTEGQSHGPRGVSGRAYRIMLREPQESPYPRRPQAVAATPQSMRPAV